jgi:membrane protein required for colicin V production
MNLLDAILIAFMVFLIVRGISRGFFREMGSLVGVILGIWIGTVYQVQMGTLLKPFVPTDTFLPVISFAVIFCVVFLLCSFAGWVISGLAKKAFLGWADKLLGAGLAILKGVIIAYLAIVLLTVLVPSKTPVIARSRMAPVIIASYQSMVRLVVPGFHEKWKRRFLGSRKRTEKDTPEQNRGPNK